ncbi:MAG TPA: hypothetical protein VGX23_05325 [Actinocrinis sp.]|nr:hypothetical protein [Actinocrinis sp.]
MTRDEQRERRRAMIAAVRTHLPWARVGAVWALVGWPGFCLAMTAVLLRQPRLLRGSTRGQIAWDLALVTLLPGTLAAVALSVALLGWPTNILLPVALLALDAALLTGSASVRGRVWVLDGWRAGVLITAIEPWQGLTRFEAGQYWALPPGRGHGLRLRQEGTRLADRFGAVLELEAMNPHLAHGPYRRSGFGIVPGHEEHRRPTMCRIPRSPAGPPAAIGDAVHVGRR